MKVVLGVLLCLVAYTLADDCDDRYKKCKEHAEKHHEKVACDEALDICRKCPVKTCDGEIATCFGKAKTHEELHKCFNAWLKCGRCYCRWQACNKHAQEHHEVNRCNLSLDVCRECDTTECDASMEICKARAKTHEDLHKCIDGWQKCGQCMCRYQKCLQGGSSPEQCARGLVLCKNCETKPCDIVLDACMKKQKTHEELHACLNAWYACVQKDCKVRKLF
jgi:peptidyl-tRNA hydrolase